MTTFDQDETGLDTANPIELYRFYGLSGSYTYTSGNRQMNFAAPSATGVETYKPVPISRSEIAYGDVTEKNEVKVTLPVNITLAADYVFDISPSDDLILEIYRLNGPTGQMRLVFYGVVSGFSVTGKKVIATCPSVFSNYLGTDFPNIYFQSNCNHVLYDARCGVNRDDFKVTATVLTFEADKESLTFTLTGDPAPGNGVYPGGAELTGTFSGTSYNYSDTAEWARYLSDYADLAAESNRQVALGSFPTKFAYAAWHYAAIGQGEGRVVHPSSTSTGGGGSVLDDGWLNVGELVVGTERRLILNQVGNNVVLNYPLRRVAIGDAITMYAGCLHTSTVCNSKFNNGDNFLGFEYIPYINPFEVGIK